MRDEHDNATGKNAYTECMYSEKHDDEDEDETQNAA